MKKGLRSINLLIMVLLLLVSMTACEFVYIAGGSEDQDGETTQEALSGESNPVSAVYNKERYVVSPVEEQTKPAYQMQYSFYDETNYYYVFYLGSISNVPLQSPDEVEVYNYDGTKFSYTLQTVQTSSSTVTQMVSVAESNCVSTKHEISLKGSVSGLTPSGLTRKIELGLSTSVSTSHTVSQTDSHTNASTFTQTHTSSQTVHFDESTPFGYYRFILLGEVDFFGVLVKNISTGEYYSDTYNVIAGKAFSLDYSESMRFENDDYEALQFHLSGDEINNLPIPSVDITEKEEEEGPDLSTTVEYNSGYSAKKIDASKTYIYDTFDISELIPFMNSDYTLKFNVQVFMKEENAGIQEIYLLNESNTRVDGNDTIEYGGSGKAHDTYGWETLEFSVDGNKCTNTMKLQYGAHGQDSDDWWRAHVKVTVTVMAK